MITMIYTICFILTLLMFISLAAIVYPFGPFKSRKMASFVAVGLFIGTGFVLTSLDSNPDYRAARELEARAGLDVAYEAMKNKNYPLAKAAIEGIDYRAVYTAEAEIASVRAEITKELLLESVSKITENSDLNNLAKLSKIKTLWQNLKDGVQAKRAVAPSLELIAQELVKSFPARELEQNQMGYEFLVDVNSYSDVPNSEYAVKVKTYADKIVAKKRKAEGCPLPNYDFSYQVPAQLNDPASFKAVRVYWGAKSGNYTQNVYMDYRAKNGFGGTITSRASGVVSLSNCKFTLVSMK